METQTMSLQLAKELEKRDEEQIMQEMRGEIVRSWVYQFTLAGRTVTNLSYAGVKEAIRRRGNVDIFPCQCCYKPVHLEERGEEIVAMMKVWDLNNNVKFLGVASARKKEPFAWVLAVNKAERNALRKLLPEKAIALLIAEWLKPLNTGPVQPPPGKLA